MADHIWNSLKTELQKGVDEESHPFKFATLATLGLERLPRLRTIKIREFDPESLQMTFYTDSRSGASQKDYTTSAAPGTEIRHPEKIEYIEQDDFFSVVYILPFKVEYLQLKRPHHLRVRFSKREGDWKSDYLVP
ncbi:MAG: hypothetical protein P8Z38_13410 [Robiginitalea sp.]